ncbi:MAG: hypothetical protein WCS77_09405, partial [Elusimicrobiaceae bacterium]
MMLRNLKIQNSETWAVTFSSDSKLLAAGGKDKLVHVWTTDKFTETAVLEPGLGAITALAFDPSGKYLFSAGRNGRIVVWDAATFKRLASLESSSKAVFALSFSPNERYIAAAYNDGIRIWRNGSFDMVKNLYTGTEVFSV